MNSDKHISVMIRKKWRIKRAKRFRCCESTVSGNVTKPDKRATCKTMEGYYRNRNKILLAKCEIDEIKKCRL